MAAALSSFPPIPSKNEQRHIIAHNSPVRAKIRDMAEAIDGNQVPPWNPFKSRLLWLAVLVGLPFYVVWIICHFPSFAIFNAVVAGLGPIFSGLLTGIVRRDWRFIGLAVVHAAFVSAIIYWVFMVPI